MAQTLILGTRRSKLAVWQADWVKRLLSDADVRVRMEAMASSGDRDRERPLYALGETGVFTKMLEDALLFGRIDLAVHSMKDLPTKLPDGLAIGAVLPRGDARDALVVRDPTWRSIADLPFGAMIGTSSLRRSAQLRGLRPDLKVVPLRGNVPNRLAKVREGRSGLSGALLAVAGLDRLGLSKQIAGMLDPMDIMPAPAQGAVAVEIRVGSMAGDLVSRIADPDTWSAVRAERAMLARLEGGCHAPIAAYTEEAEGRRTLYGRVTALDGSRTITDQITLDASQPEASGSKLADALLAKGAAELVRAARDGSADPSAPAAD